MNKVERAINGNAMMDIKRYLHNRSYWRQFMGGFFWTSRCDHDLVCFA